MKTIKNKLTLGGLLLILFAITAMPIKSNSVPIDKEETNIVHQNMAPVPGYTDDFWCVCPFFIELGCTCNYTIDG